MTIIPALYLAAAFAYSGPPAVDTGRIQVDQSKNWEVFTKLYPKRALAAGEQGLVAFKLTLDRAGHPTACQVTHTSGFKQLDEETCTMLMMHSVFQPPKDAEGNRLNLFHTEGVINWRIPGREASLKQPAKLAKLDPLEKKICKRTPRTGTLAGFDRVCMTAREWDKTRQENLEDYEEQRKRGFTQGNN